MNRGGAAMGNTNERGLSLIEVILALGLMAGVLISVAGLFILSERQVKSGKTATQALAVGRAVSEEMTGWGFKQTYRVFGDDGTAASYTYDTRTEAFAAKWQTMLDDSLQYGSYATILVAAVPPESGGSPNLNACRAIRITVTVFWAEGDRNRSVRVMTVRI
jgi:type II secretory pathway pseudopilin PulG